MLILNDEAKALVLECIDSELEHTSDMIREMPDDTDEEREAIRVQRIREERIQAVREGIAE